MASKTNRLDLQRVHQHIVRIAAILWQSRQPQTMSASAFDIDPPPRHRGVQHSNKRE
jgi:hypothetical protein